MDSIAVDAIGHDFAPAGPKEGFDAIPMWVADMNLMTCTAKNGAKNTGRPWTIF